MDIREKPRETEQGNRRFQWAIFCRYRGQSGWRRTKKEWNEEKVQGLGERRYREIKNNDSWLILII
jgi:hypothetical protein